MSGCSAGVGSVEGMNMPICIMTHGKCGAAGLTINDGSFTRIGDGRDHC